jgi:hypothetical protein
LEHPADESGAEVEREMNMNTQGKHTQRADKAINAGQVARNLRRMLAEAKGSDDVARVKDEALAMPGIYPNNEKLFMEIVADINRMNGTGPATVEDVAKLGAQIERVAEANAKAATPAKKARRVKDTRPRWGADERIMYDIKLHELIESRKSNREAAQDAIKWAAENPKLAQYKTPSASCLEKWAAAERKLTARKRKRS